MVCLLYYFLMGTSVCTHFCVCLVWREMQSQLDRARESQMQTIQQTDMALEQFKKQVELSSEKAYADMKLQVWCTKHS